MLILWFSKAFSAKKFTSFEKAYNSHLRNFITSIRWVLIRGGNLRSLTATGWNQELTNICSCRTDFTYYCNIQIIKYEVPHLRCYATANVAVSLCQLASWQKTNSQKIVFSLHTRNNQVYFLLPKIFLNPSLMLKQIVRQ